MSNEEPRISVSNAVAAAMKALPTFLARPATNLRVEEVVPPAGSSDVWRVTLSHLEPKHESMDVKTFRRVFQSLAIAPEEAATERVYHVIEVDPTTGAVGAMRMREPR